MGTLLKRNAMLETPSDAKAQATAALQHGIDRAGQRVLANTCDRTGIQPNNRACQPSA